LETTRFVAFQPYASTAPHETWIMPRAQEPSFGTATDDELDDLANVLRNVLSALSQVLGDPDYNLILQSAPPADEDSDYFVWHVRISPRLTTPAGFELGTGMAVNPSLPEDTAGQMRLHVAPIQT
jgi:UDPglucose--hexose-1-phosphate uridylyltransferase